MLKKIISVILVILAALSCISTSCITTYYCSCCDNDLGCSKLITTAPRKMPVYYNNNTDAILFSNGEVVDFNDHWFDGDYNSFDLRDICLADTIVGIYYYRHRLEWENYSIYSDVDIENDSCILVLTSNNICKLDYSYSLISAYGNEGDSSTSIHQAVSADINYLGEIFVLDVYDNGVKHYSYDGEFINSWTVDGDPAQIQLFNDFLYILGTTGNTLRKYDSEGNYVDSFLENISILEPVIIEVYDDNEFWIADMAGKRIQRINDSGEIKDTYHSYCFYDINYKFGKIVSIFGDDDDFVLVDTENNHLIVYYDSF